MMEYTDYLMITYSGRGYYFEPKRAFLIQVVTMEEKIITLHPQGKQGVNISKDKYDMVKQGIIDALKECGEMTFYQLNDTVSERLAGRFEGSIGWYYTTVMLDLEARKIIQRIPGAKPQRIRLVQY